MGGGEIKVIDVNIKLYTSILVHTNEGPNFEPQFNDKSNGKWMVGFRFIATLLTMYLLAASTIAAVIKWERF